MSPPRWVDTDDNPLGLLPRPHISEDTEQGRLGFRLAFGKGPIDPLADQTLVPARRVLLAIEIPVEVDQEPIPLFAGAR
jgi:hypothetical protein